MTLLRASFAQQLQGLFEQGGDGAQGLAARCPLGLHFLESSRFPAKLDLQRQGAAK